MTFHLRRDGRENYDQFIVTDPPVVAWELSVDDGATWHAGEALAGDDVGWYRWLIAGDRAALGAAIANLAVGDHQPLGRAISNPEIVVRPLENIRVE